MEETINDTDSSTGGVLVSTWNEVEELRRSYETNLTRPDGSLLDIVTTDDGPTIAFCHFMSLIPYDGSLLTIGYETSFSIALAVHHLNTGNGSLIEPVEGLSDRCNIRFTLDFEDTLRDPGHTLNLVVRLTGDDYGGGGGDFTNSTLVDDEGQNLQSEQTEKFRRPSAFIGAFRSAVSAPSSMVSGLRNYPQLSGASTSVALDDKEQYPRFGRTIPSDDGITVAIILHLINRLDITHLAVVSVNDNFGNTYIDGFRKAIAKLAPDMDILQININVEGDYNSIKQAIKTLKESQYRFVFGIFNNREMHDNVMLEALRQNVAGNGEHNWVFPDLFISVLQDRWFALDDPLRKAYRGVGLFKASGSSGEKFGIFSDSVRALNTPEDFELMKSILPAYDDSPNYNDEVFLDPIYDFASFFYEATILMGLAACEAVGPDMRLTGDDFYHHILNYPSFQGVTGTVDLDPKTGSRIPDSAFYVLNNFVEVQALSPTTNQTMVRFKSVLTNRYHAGKWEEVTPYIYNDGTSNKPVDIPLLSIDPNYIAPGIRAVAWLFFVISMMMTGGFCFWAWKHRDTRVVKASQPFFLYILCGGCAILACSIIALQFDTSIASLDGCSIACTATVWLVCIGFAIIFSSLYAKTSRINKIMRSAKHYKRIELKVRDALKPMVILMILNIIFLSIMTALDPSVYTIYVVQKDRFGQPIETYGHCDWKYSLPYLVPLALINIIVVILASIEAWRARNLTTEFAESQDIARALSLILIVSFIGLPVLIVASDNPNASAFVSTGIVFVMCCTILCLIFIPKIKFEREARQKKSRRNVVKISGLDFDTSSGNFGPGSMVANDARIRPISEDTTESEDFGERILTTKTQKELAQENAALKRVLDLEREKYKALKNGSVPLGEEKPEAFESESLVSSGTNDANIILSKLCDAGQENIGKGSDVETPCLEREGA